MSAVDEIKTWADLRALMAYHQVTQKALAERLGLTAQDFGTHVGADVDGISSPLPEFVTRAATAIEELSLLNPKKQKAVA